MNGRRASAMRAASLLTEHWGRRRRRRNPGVRRKRDLARTTRWGWEENIVGVAVAPKVVSGEVASTAPGLTFYVRRKLARRRLSGDEFIPPELRLPSVAPGTFATDVVVVSEVPRAHVHQPGTELGHYRNPPGTSGLIVRNADDDVCVLSCSHVLARSGRDVSEGDPIEQPWVDDYQAVDVIATLTRDFTVIGATNTEDVALAKLIVDADPTLAGTNRRVTAVCSRSAGQFQQGTETELRGFKNQSTGRIVGSGNWKVDMPFAGIVEMRGLVSYATVCQRGDSGGVVLERGTTTALGMHIAGIAEDGLGLFLPLGPVFGAHELRLV